MNLTSENINQITDEIVDLYARLNAKYKGKGERVNINIEPGWVSLGKGKTLRDFVLYESGFHSNDKVLVCPTSFVQTTDRSSIHCDHFYPKEKIYHNIDRILDAANQNNELLNQLLNKITNKLITETGESKEQAEALASLFLSGSSFDITSRQIKNDLGEDKSKQEEVLSHIEGIIQDKGTKRQNKSALKKYLKQKLKYDDKNLDAIADNLLENTQYKILKTLFYNDDRNLWGVSAGYNLHGGASSHVSLLVNA